MRAMILAAGLGTRLRPLTWTRPKALVPVLGMPLIHFWIWQLHQADCEAVVVNAYHLHEQMVHTIERTNWPIPVHVRVEPVLLGTAGGIRNVLDFFQGKPFAVINGDTLCRAPLAEFYHAHLDSGTAVSLVMHDYPVFNNVAVQDDECILGFGKDARAIETANPDVRLRAFTGIHFLHPDVLQNVPLGEPAEIVPLYRKLIEAGRPPRAIYDSNLYWREIGSLDAYRRVNEELCELSQDYLPPIRTGLRIHVDPRAHVSDGAILKGMIVVGQDSEVMEGAELENVILWDRVRVEANARLRNCIVTDGMRVSGHHKDRIITESA